MIRNVVTICTGNICRSPVAEAALKSLKSELEISSAGLHALTGQGVDSDSLNAANALGLHPDNHVARQFTNEIGREADLLLVMEDHHRREIARRWPQYLGKTFLIGHFEDGKQIADPYKMGKMMHFEMAEQVLESSRIWSSHLED